MSTGTATAGVAPVAARTSPYAWIVLGMLCFVYIFNFLDRQLMSILTESIKRDLGFTDTQMGYMTGFWFALVYTLFGVVVGFLADRTSRRNILFAGVFLWSLFTALCGFSKNYPTMLAARIGVGVGEAAGAPPSYSIISDYFPPEKRGLALALFSLGVPFGQALGAGFGAKIDAMWGWEMAFIGIGAAGIGASFLLLLIVREPKRGAMDATSSVTLEQAHANAAERSGFITTLWAFVNRPVLLWAALACGMCSFVGYCALNWNASFLIRVKGITREELALYYAFMLAGSMGAGTLVSGAMADWLAKRGRVWYAIVPMVAMAAAVPFWLAYVAAPTWQMALVILAAPTFFTIMYLPPALAVVQNSVKPSQRTMSGAILLMVLNMIGLGGGPTMVGILSDMFAKQAAAGGMEPAAASAEGLTQAFWWVTPFYGVAVFFLILQAMALARETKAGVPIRDGGARLGIVLLFIGVAGLGWSFYSKGLDIAAMMPTDIMSSVQTVLLVVSTVLGVLFSFKGLSRKADPAAA